MEDKKVNHVKVCYAHLPHSPIKIAMDFFLALPPEIRNKIYTMVIANTPGIPQNTDRAIGEFSLCQPALAQVNRQLRHEILPMWYSEKSFGTRIYPKMLSEAAQVWQGFLDRFNAHTTGADGSSYLSRIQRLEVELWHPAFDPDPLRRARRTSFFNDFYHIPDPSDSFPLKMSNGVYLQFGPINRPVGMAQHPRVGDDDSDWSDYAAVRALLRAAIVEDRSNQERHPWKLEFFWKTFPFERLVGLVMMIAVECKEAARLVRVGTSFAALEHPRPTAGMKRKKPSRSTRG
ncbi:hypothetical protein Daus18300_007161 [Diaporthe australafricana]|uniref:Uncharacterized protein n=1 Tax=Diaporthe australafricana TaxID=127596 RepID=A0ABR3WPC5_9PEZI